MEKIKGVFSKKNVIVTGGAGFIGSHICEELLRKGESQVICVDNLVSSNLINIDHFLQNPDFKFLRYDIREPLDLSKFPELSVFNVAVAGIQEIYNCASPTTYKDPKKLPMETALTNSLGLINVLDLAKQYQAKVVHLSTSAIYGDPLPESKYFKEDYWGFVDPLGSRAAYNESKRFAETLCSIYNEQEGVIVSIARVFASYGPRMAMAVGKLIPDFIAAALSNRDLVVYGGAEETTSYCYVKDTVDALFRLMANGRPGAYNVGSPDEHKVADVAAKVIELAGASSKISFADPLPDFTRDGRPDIKKIKDELSWFPVIALEDGLKQTIQYMESARSHYEQEGLWEAESA